MKKVYFSLALITLFIGEVLAQQIEVKYSPEVFNEAFTGNVIVYMSKENKEPKTGYVGSEKFPCFSVYVENIQPGEVITIDDNANSYPTSLSNIERGEYYIQTVWDRNLGGRSIAYSPGNLYNRSEKIDITKDTTEIFSITATEMNPEGPEFNETVFAKELKVPSALLSEFHGKPMTINAAVILPIEYFQEPDEEYPVLFTVSGYGGDYHRFSGDTLPSPNFEDIQVIKVYLDGNCALGHSTYANSDNNGPWGDALTKEFIPQLEKKYRANGARLLTGHSSGGWTVLWLQTQYPEIFDGCWSSAPDPVDFRSFQKINLYKDTNMFYDENGSLRSVASVGGFIPWGTMKDVYQMEKVVYRGEQMHSFNAVFSKKAADGNPEHICDSETGKINTKVFSNWKKYDIALQLRSNWESLKQELEGKIRVSVGHQDNFLLNHSVYMLEGQMKRLGSEFEFAYYPGDHFTVLTPEYYAAGNEFLRLKYMEWLAESSRSKD